MELTISQCFTPDLRPSAFCDGRSFAQTHGEKTMHRIVTALFASAAACTGLLAASPSWAQAPYPYGTYSSYPGYSYGYGYPYAGTYGYSSDYGNPFSIITAPIAAMTAPLTALAAPVAGVAAAPVAATAAVTTPLVTGRSIATGQMGRMCSTPARSCELYHASWVGNGCSCRVAGGLTRGSVTP